LRAFEPASNYFVCLAQALAPDPLPLINLGVAVQNEQGASNASLCFATLKKKKARRKLLRAYKGGKCAALVCFFMTLNYSARLGSVFLPLFFLLPLRHLFLHMVQEKKRRGYMGGIKYGKKSVYRKIFRLFF
jgi:hypothetical protein